MSKKDVDMSVSSLADNALDDSEKNLDYEEFVKREKDYVPVRLFLGKRHRFPLSVSSVAQDLFFSVDSNYPLSQTDQVHNLSISEQVRRGQGDLDSELDKSSFDFPDGKDDGSSGVGVFEFSNRVDQWIAEQNLSSELKESFRSQVLQQQADKAMKSAIDTAQRSKQSQEPQQPKQSQEPQQPEQ